MALLKSLNLLLAFLIELAMLAAYGYWGFQLHVDTWLKVVIGIGIPLVVAVAWGLFMSPKANYYLPQPWFLIAQVVLFGGAALALYSTGKATLAAVFAVVIALNLVLVAIWKQ